MKHYKEYYGHINDLYVEAVNLIHKKQKLSYVEEILNILLLNHPCCPLLLYQMGNLHLKKNQPAIAEVFYQKSLDLKPDFPECLTNIGVAYKDMQMIDKAREAFKKALDFVSGFDGKEICNIEKADYWHNYASTFAASGRPEEALPIANKAIEMNPEKPDTYWNRGLAYLELGNYEKGFEDYDKGARIQETKRRNYSLTDEPTPFWDGTPGKMVAVYGEQGIGDELMFASILPDLMKDCEVVLDMHPRLVDMFRNTYPNIPIFGTRKFSKLAWTRYYKIDAKVSVGTLGKFYRKKKEDFPGTPYLKPFSHLVEKYKQKLGSLSEKKKIGISWKGGTSQTNMNERKIKLKQLMPLLDIEGVDFISLQYHEDSPIHLEKLKNESGKIIHHWQEVLDDYDETAGLIRNLDYIISVPQSVVHLAGAIGVPTLQLCPKKAMWQMGPYGENMPWYSCVENAWQKEVGDWEPVILQAKEKLCSLLQNNT